MHALRLAVRYRPYKLDIWQRRRHCSSVMQCNVNVFLSEKFQAQKFWIAVLPEAGYKIRTEVRGPSSCRGNSQFSLKSWRQPPMQPPKPHSDVKHCNPAVKLKIQWNAASPLEKPKNTHCKPMDLGMQQSPPETQGPALGREDLLSLGVQEGEER